MTSVVIVKFTRILVYCIHQRTFLPNMVVFGRFHSIDVILERAQLNGCILGKAVTSQLILVHTHVLYHVLAWFALVFVMILIILIEKFMVTFRNKMMIAYQTRCYFTQILCGDF